MLPSILDTVDHFFTLTGLSLAISDWYFDLTFAQSNLSGCMCTNTPWRRSCRAKDNADPLASVLPVIDLKQVFKFVNSGIVYVLVLGKWLKIIKPLGLAWHPATSTCSNVAHRASLRKCLLLSVFFFFLQYIQKENHSWLLWWGFLCFYCQWELCVFHVIAIGGDMYYCQVITLLYLVHVLESLVQQQIISYFFLYFMFCHLCTYCTITKIDLNK